MPNEIAPASTSADQAYVVKEKLARLDSLLQDAAPGLPTLLRDIHQILKKDPDVVTILSDSECNILVRGLKKQTATEIATSAVKKGTKKSLKQMTLADL